MRKAASCGTLKRPVPYRLGESGVCVYEDSDEPVLMGDMVTVFYGYGPDGDEHTATGELSGVTYGQDGFIDEVELYDGDGNAHRYGVPCELFFKGGAE